MGRSLLANSTAFVFRSPLFKGAGNGLQRRRHFEVSWIKSRKDSPIRSLRRTSFRHFLLDLGNGAYVQDVVAIICQEVIG